MQLGRVIQSSNPNAVGIRQFFFANPKSSGFFRDIYVGFRFFTFSLESFFTFHGTLPVKKLGSQK